MVSLKKNQSGFTIVELLIVIVIIGILAGLVMSTFVGVQQKARNSERQTDINTISGQLEAYYAKNSGYPALADISGTSAGDTFRAANEIRLGDGNKALADPSAPTITTLGTTAPNSVGGAYSYEPLPTSCVSPTTSTGAPRTGTFCTSYTLTAFMEGSTPKYVKKSAN
ncbi:prepilin-type N-terminal cleavage/methylation domain-containing protein [Candidatus Saccharibacteria bacterium]|nr:prepilin-type N-terminal cleavage/methylation domain-containing protein [Candidatus Saccharibacteria bacterium]